MMKKRIGLMGGTFDPIHYGHLVAAEGARYQFGLDKVVFVPSGKPPHKSGYQVTEAEHRYNMVSLAITSNPCFEVSKEEIERQGPSYTIDTVLRFLKLFPEQTEVFFITGADAILEIFSWKSVHQLLDLCFFIAATRPGYQLKEIEHCLTFLTAQQQKKIMAMEVPALAISSTDIRQRIMEGKPIKYLLPEEVEQYINQNHLYQNFK